MRTRTAFLAAALTCLVAFSCARKAPSITGEEARAIAKVAYVYAFPMVDSYRILHAYYLDPANPEYKGDVNVLMNTARVYTPEDRAVQTPNSDTPYSFFCADLRTQPMVVTVPEIDPKRYYSVQFVDAYTHNFAYAGSRTSGNGPGNFLLAGPDWQGETPSGINDVVRCESNLAFAIIRTQLFGPEDIDNVKAIQAGYKLMPLSEFMGTEAPAPAPALDYPKPLTGDAEKTSPEVFVTLNFLLTSFCPTVPSETELMARFAKIHVGPGETFEISTFSPGVQQAIKDGIADAWAEFQEFKKAKIDTGEVTSGDMFGTREFIKNNYLYRMSAAILGIYGNSKDEAMYPVYAMDADGNPFNGDGGHYTVHFDAGQFPPVNAFWSLTMYQMPASLLVANPINRYLINSPMLPNLVKDKDGGLTIYIQNESPGKDKEANWLPAPRGPFAMAMRLYWPREEALNGTWHAPKAIKVQ